MIFVTSLRQSLAIALLVLSLTVSSATIVVSAAYAASNDFEKGLHAARSGHMDRAINLWTKMIKRDPKSYAAYVNRGQAHIRMGRVFNGVSDWHRAKELAPIFAYATFTGDFIMEESKNQLVSFTAPLELDPDYLPSVLMTAVTYLDVGRSDKAIELYRKSHDLTTNPLLKSYFEHWAASLDAAPKE